MSQPYIGEIRPVPYNFAPEGWAFCDGSLLPISEFAALFDLIGTTYGGDGQQTFALPDLRGRVAVHMGGSFIPTQGALYGSETVALTLTEMPAHTHTLGASNQKATTTDPTGAVPASSFREIYGGPAYAPLAADTIEAMGGSQSHSNIQPYLCISYIISLFGVFPSP